MAKVDFVGYFCSCKLYRTSGCIGNC